MATVNLTAENFEDVIKSNDFVMVDFWAPWCGPCRSFAPIYEQAAENYEDIVFAKVNTEEEQALAGHFQVRSIPTLMIFREQVIIFAQPGALPASALDQLIEQARGLDMTEVHRQIAEGQAEQSS